MMKTRRKHHPIRDTLGDKLFYAVCYLITALFMLVTTWIVATLNPSILGMIETLGGPIIAMILFLMPMYAIQKVPAMRKYSGHISNVFVVVMGLIAISAIFYSLFS